MIFPCSPSQVAPYEQLEQLETLKVPEGGWPEPPSEEEADEAAGLTNAERILMNAQQVKKDN